MCCFICLAAILNVRARLRSTASQGSLVWPSGVLVSVATVQLAADDIYDI